MVQLRDTTLAYSTCPGYIGDVLTGVLQCGVLGLGDVLTGVLGLGDVLTGVLQCGVLGLGDVLTGVLLTRVLIGQ